MGLLSHVRSTFVGKCCKGNFGMTRFLQSNDFQRKLILSSGKEYEHFSKRSYSSPSMTPGTESTTAITKFKMPNIGSEGFAFSSFLSTVNRNSSMINFSSCFKTPVKPEQIAANPVIRKMTTGMEKIPRALRWMCGGFPAIAFCDAPEPWQLGFQDAATPIMQGIMDLHHDIFFFLVQIAVFVLWVLSRALWCFRSKISPIPQRIVHGTTIEILWTILPSIILMFIAIPSFTLLYSMDDVVVDPAITIKAIGHQWYWSYEYSDYNNSDEQSLAFDSYMVPEDDLELGQLRLLEVDNRVVVPAKTHLRVLITSADVLHSWAVPSLGVKCDAVPGRLNQISTFIQREGVYYGQCSEICGTNHAFMPIVVEAVSTKDYGSWVSNQIQ
ncbi:cytochrome c oxidase subunit 2, mitochondrial [Vigna umbellata]|uniref:cytochrome c oxidase subunit 2, mitochondrial n=1 Tax=Vigna umbellata TaxID=87088 RepID=UPI001F5F77F7|nr:cytochrome c oxidase subunit 2, mitochondrial [Vigna umbellata]XP_047168202.1 cytochrome c oxidase subunit 2, mitochondrial [Vigna umbellata]